MSSKKYRFFIFILVILFLVILVITVINHNQKKEAAILKSIGEAKPNTMKPAIMLDGSLYYTTGRTIDKKKLDLNSVSQVKSVVKGTEYPEKKEEINLPFEDAKYVRVGDDVAVEIDGSWIVFKKDE